MDKDIIVRGKGVSVEDEGVAVATRSVLNFTGGVAVTDDPTNGEIDIDISGGGVDTSGTPEDNDFAKFTDANTIEGRSYAEVLADIFSVALPEDVGIILDPALSADGTYSGIVEAGTAGATLAFGDLVYLAVADSRWELTDADAEATAFGKIGICVLAAGSDGNATTILLFGKVRADTAFPALTIGAPVFIGTTAGDIVTTAPSGVGDIIRIIGQGNTADELFFHPDNTFIEHA